MKRIPSIFNEALAPVTPGPSSSNTAGPMRIASVCRQFFGLPITKASIEMSKFGSFPFTYFGMRSDLAFVFGLLGHSPSDPGFFGAYEEAKEKAISTKASLSGCPLVLLVCYDSDEVWHNPREEGYNCGEQDASSVALHMMFEATELGVHSLWIRGFNSDEVRKAFNLPENHVPAMMVALGYPSEKSHPAKLHSNKKPLEETVKFI